MPYTGGKRPRRHVLLLSRVDLLPSVTEAKGLVSRVLVELGTLLRLGTFDCKTLVSDPGVPTESRFPRTNRRDLDVGPVRRVGRFPVE